MIELDKIEELVIPNFRNGEGDTKTRMFSDGKVKIMRTTLEKDCSIGRHIHDTSCEVISVLSGTANFTLDDGEEVLTAGQCHYCPKGSYHSVKNVHEEPLVMFCVVPEQ